MELRIYDSIGRAIARRPAIDRGGSGFSYHRPVLTILIIFIALSALEIPILDLIVHRWPVARIVVLIIGVWGLTWMIGLLCAYYMRPHVVGPGGIRIRDGLETDLFLDWDDIASVARIRQVDPPKSPRFTEHEGSRVLSLRMQDEVNIEIRLERSTTLHLPGRPPKGGSQTADVIRIWTDDPTDYLAAVDRHMP
ncbi:hypothetical protein [Microbacterium hominis]|uniref:PH domain-containing protein n=1 Tax=Microbacterium hominis TaxID=162426 RepID=A0A7D4QAY2_9MICO|nr:hypothetical protein [Microbacterium hominis]QKJ18017.1 hypothetical protein HQM25_00335 [Microbacterium hominis]